MNEFCRLDQKEFFDSCHIINHIPDAFLLVDEQGRIVASNDTVKEVLGWKPNEIIGSDIEILISPDLRNKHKVYRQQFYKEPFHRNMNELVNLSALHKKGYNVPVDIKLSFISIKDRIYGIAILRDATVQRKLHKSLEEKNQTLEKTVAEKNHLLGIAAHDMRNPIGMIQNFAQILMTESIGALNEDQTEFVNRIHQSAVFMAGLLEDLLDLSSIESGTMNLRKEEFRFGDLMKDILLANYIHAQEKNISLEVNCDDCNELRLTADKRKFHQVFHNLIDNAIKYSPENTTVNIVANKSEKHFDFSVKDHGVGIPEEDLASLSQPFFRARNKPTGGEKSTGLGLYITNRIIEAHGGTLKVDSQNGKGSVFTVEIPIN